GPAGRGASRGGRARRPGRGPARHRAHGRGRPGAVGPRGGGGGRVRRRRGRRARGARGRAPARRRRGAGRRGGRRAGGGGPTHDPPHAGERRMSLRQTTDGERATHAPAHGAPPDGPGTALSTSPDTDAALGIVRGAAVVVEDGRVAWTGPAAQAPAADDAVDL